MGSTISQNIGGINVILHAPSYCPYCHVTQLCKFLFANKEKNPLNFISVWQCTNGNCQKNIIVENVKQANTSVARFVRFIESIPLSPNWPIPIKNLKNGLDIASESKFISTYMQSLQAESMGLDEIAGMGFRKAIEYLVKDVACRDNPEEVEKIKSKTLTSVVKDYFTGDLRDVLERAVWLGNDQTHYYKIFEQFDVTMVKELIDFILSDLDREYKKAHYNESIRAYNKPNNNTSHG